MAFICPKTQKTHFVLGIAGIASGLGTTHLCIALANFLSSKKCQKTACIELSNSFAFEQLIPYQTTGLLAEKKPAHRYFEIYDVDYYPNAQIDELPTLLNAGYEMLVLDFGQLQPKFLQELARCDRKFILGSSAPWRQTDWHYFLSRYPEIKNMEFLLYLANYGTKPDMIDLSKKLSISHEQLRTVPFLLNPFRIEKEQFSFFEELL